jgi:hypothetical protein
MDLYRVNLFKKKLREIIGAPWLRFYWSKGRCHLCIEAHDFVHEDITEVIRDLKNAAIEFKLIPWGSIFGNTLRLISIPIDQEALPERTKKQRPHGTQRLKWHD